MLFNERNLFLDGLIPDFSFCIVLAVPHQINCDAVVDIGFADFAPVAVHVRSIGMAHCAERPAGVAEYPVIALIDADIAAFNIHVAAGHIFHLINCPYLPGQSCGMIAVHLSPVQLADPCLELGAVEDELSFPDIVIISVVIEHNIVEDFVSVVLPGGRLADYLIWSAHRFELHFVGSRCHYRQLDPVYLCRHRRRMVNQVVPGLVFPGLPHVNWFVFRIFVVI